MTNRNFLVITATATTGVAAHITHVAAAATAVIGSRWVGRRWLVCGCGVAAAHITLIAAVVVVDRWLGCRCGVAAAHITLIAAVVVVGGRVISRWVVSGRIIIAAAHIAHVAAVV